MKNKRVKQMICDVISDSKGLTRDKSQIVVWDTMPCWICFKTMNFLYMEGDTVSLTADQLCAIRQT